MRITHPILIKILEKLLGHYIRFVGITSRVIYKGHIPLEELRRNDRPHLYVFWHNRIFMFCWLFRNTGFSVPISLHRDGEIIASIASGFGYHPIRGSTSKNSLKVFAGITQELKKGHVVAITPDGPRGPKYSMQEGVLWAAYRTGAPVSGASWSAKRVIKFRSWDNFIFPLPFNIFYIRTLGNMYIKTKESIPEMAQRLKRKLDRITKETEDYFKSEII